MALVEHRHAQRALSLTSFWRAATKYLELRRSRHALARLEDYQLDDIGVSIEEARREAKRTVWDVPANWVDK